jgi:hypothetical protein
VQAERITRSEYIAAYKDIAIKEMNEYGIPASITLAQGILESGDGNSELAQKANNHFGIKCRGDWTGKKVYHDDDRKNECFRKYSSPLESYRDHSLFLRNGQRYAFLFDLEPTDYKGWAKGLKKAGYATNPKYDDLLIRLIEENHLHQYDLIDVAQEVSPTEINPAQIFVSDNNLEYIITAEKTSWQEVEEITGKSVRKIQRWNELRYDDVLSEGQILYLHKKRDRSKNKKHRVQEGEDMYLISQRYGIKLHRLYKLNRMNPGEQPQIGEVLNLRWKRKKNR